MTKRVHRIRRLRSFLAAVAAGIMLGGLVQISFVPAAHAIQGGYEAGHGKTEMAQAETRKRGSGPLHLLGDYYQRASGLDRQPLL
jgi:hypothetical protein